MKHFRLSLAAVILTLALALSAFAGDVQFPLTVAATGQIEIGIASASGILNEVASVNPVTDVALNLVQSLLPLC